MTRNRDFKDLVRARMAETGERYATARAQILSRTTRPKEPPAGDGLFAGYGKCGGAQSETGALSNVLRFVGLESSPNQPLSENLIFGLCGGIGFLYGVFEYKGLPPMLTLIGRARSMPDRFVADGLERLSVAVPAKLTIEETGGVKRAQADLDAVLDDGRPALCTVDAAGLPYFGMPSTMKGMSPHVLAVVGRTGDNYWVDDRAARPILLSKAELADARGGYRKGKHRLVSFEALEKVRNNGLEGAVIEALLSTVRSYDEPPAKPFASNVGSAGLRKWARLLKGNDKKSWRKVFPSGETAYVGLRRLYDCTQYEYTAPDASRPMFANYLDEARAITGIEGLTEVAQQIREAGTLWATLGSRVVECGDDAVARGCALSDERARRLDDGEATARSMEELWAERRDLARSCTLDVEQSGELYSELGDIVEAIAERERTALDHLADLLP